MITASKIKSNLNCMNSKCILNFRISYFINNSKIVIKQCSLFGTTAFIYAKWL